MPVIVLTGQSNKLSSFNQNAKCLPGQSGRVSVVERSVVIFYALHRGVPYLHNQVRRENAVDMATRYELDGSIFEHR